MKPITNKVISTRRIPQEHKREQKTEKISLLRQRTNDNLLTGHYKLQERMGLSQQLAFVDISEGS